jgi:hypothetical protein
MSRWQMRLLSWLLSKCQHPDAAVKHDYLGYKASHVVDYCTICGALRDRWRDREEWRSYGRWERP